MAPEQLRGESLDSRADVFAFGVTAWEVLSGRRPFVGADAAALLEAIARGPKADDRRALPAAVAEVLARCLRSRREDRPASVEEVVAVLTAARGRRGPVRALLAAGAVAAAAALTVATVIATRDSRAAAPPACDPAAAPRWDGASAAWSAAAQSLSPFVRESIAALMDRRSAAWRSAADLACRQSPIAQQVWLSCRRQLEGREAVILDFAVESRRQSDDRPLLWAFEGLELPTYCASTEAAEDAVARAALPSDADRALVDDGLGWIARAEALADLGATDELEAALAHAEAIASQVGASPLDGELALARVTLQPRTVPSEQAAALDAAAATVERSGRTSLVARAWLGVAVQAIANENDQDAIDRALARADWAITRLGDPGRLRVSWWLTSANAAWARGDRAGARERFAASAAIVADDPLIERGQRGALVSMATMAGDDREAAATLRELLADADMLRRAGATVEVDLRVLLAECLYRQGELADAQAEAERARALARSALSATDPDRITIDSVLASILHDRGDAAGALALLESALPRLVASLGADHPMVADGHVRTAQVLLSLDRPDESGREAREAIAIFDARFGRGNEYGINARILLADSFRGEDRLVKRAAFYDEVIAAAEALFGTQHPMWAQIAVSYGWVLMKVDRHVEARHVLERALPVLVSAGFAPGAIGNAQFALAILVEPTDPRRALELATAAETALAGDPTSAEAYAGVKRWLSELR